MSSEENVLTPTTAFVSLVLFDIMKMPLALLPLLLVYVVEVRPPQFQELIGFLGNGYPAIKWKFGNFSSFPSINKIYFFRVKGHNLSLLSHKKNTKQTHKINQKTFLK